MRLSTILSLGLYALPGAHGLWGQPTVVEYSVPSRPYGIANGPDGNLWITEPGANRIAKVTTSGVFTEYSIPTPDGSPLEITPGPDGNLWFTEAASKIGKISPQGIITEYPLPVTSFSPQTITAGPDGNLWFSNSYGIDGIAKITTNGVVTQCDFPSPGFTTITAGPDGNVWFIEPNGRLGKVTPSGTITLYQRFGSGSLTVGPDGNLWITSTSTIWKVKPTGEATPYFVPFPPNSPFAITAGPDGNLWFQDLGGGRTGPAESIIRLTPDGVFTQYPLTHPGFMTAGPDGNLWFLGNNTISKFILSTVPSNRLLTLSQNSLTFTNAVRGSPPAPQTLAISSSEPSAFTASAVSGSSRNWLNLSPSGNLTTPASLTVSVDEANLPGPATYVGNIALTTGNVTQIVLVTVVITGPPAPVIRYITNAASQFDGSIAPGEIVTIYGTGLGPVTPLGWELDSTGKAATSLGGVSVSFNGYLAPLLYVSSGQLNCVVPYEVPERGNVQVQVTYSERSLFFSVPVAVRAPGIFTLNGSGAGTVAAANRGGGYNGSDNPAPAASTITFYLTGEGPTNPPGVTGKVTTISTSGGPLTPQPVVPPLVLINSKPATITFYGEAPGMVAGVMQLNVRVPDGLTPGSASLIVTLANYATQFNVKVWVQ